MSRLAGWWYRLRELVRPGTVSDELDEELRDHLRREVERQFRDDVSPEQVARRAALRAGNVVAARDGARDERPGRVLGDLGRDVAVALRALRRAPAYAGAVLLSLSLATGGVSAVYSVAHAALVQPLPYASPGELHVLRVWWNDFSARPSDADLRALEDVGGPVGRTAAFFEPDDGFALTTDEGPRLVMGAIVTGSLPAVLGVSPVVGGGFSSVADAPEALISVRVWRSQFGGDAGVVGRHLVIDDNPYQVVGVMPETFDVPGQRGGDVWLKALTRQPTRRGPFYYFTVVRTSLPSDIVAERLTTIVEPVLRERYGVNERWHYGATPLHATLVRDARPSLLLLLAAVGLVLLIAVVNIANLMLARNAARAPELHVRAALGASRWRLVRQAGVEALILGAGGGTAGAAVAAVVLALASQSLAAVFTAIAPVALDGRTVAVAVTLGVSAAVVAGVLPATRLSWQTLAMQIRGSGRGAGTVPGQTRLRQLLIVTETALAVVVLVGAALLGRSLQRLQTVDPGFDADGLVSFRLSLPDDRYRDAGRLPLFLRALEERLRNGPGVTAVAFAQALPPDRLVISNNYTVEGTVPGQEGRDVAEMNVVSPGYFSTLNIRVLGRPFTADDGEGSERVAIVNEAFVRRHFRDGRAVGHRLKTGDWDAAAPWTTIVGVAANVPYGKGLWGGTDATIYVAYEQNPWATAPYVVVRSTVPTQTALAAAGAAVAAIDPSLPLRDVATMPGRLAASIAGPRLRALVLGLLGGLALALAVTGLYGLLAYRVTEQRRDTAIRRALGAQDWSIVGTVVSGGLRLVGTGLAVGLAVAAVGGRMLERLLFGITPYDPVAMVGVSAVLVGTALVATVLPAARAVGVETAEVLREQ
jgi:predicted permease